MEYKFKSPVPTHLQGLASYLAHHITDPTLQKSSMVANGEWSWAPCMALGLLISPGLTASYEKEQNSHQQSLCASPQGDRGPRALWETLARDTSWPVNSVLP